MRKKKIDTVNNTEGSCMNYSASVSLHSRNVRLPQPSTCSLIAFVCTQNSMKKS